MPVMTTRGGDESDIETDRVGRAKWLESITPIQSGSPTAAAHRVEGTAKQDDNHDTFHHVQPPDLPHIGRSLHWSRLREQ
jgi:hypothetical protein